MSEDTIKRLRALLPGLKKTAKSLSDCPAGEELLRAIVLIEELVC